MWQSFKNGWLGIDVGSANVKVAQLVQNRSGLSVQASAIVPRQWASSTGGVDEPCETSEFTRGEIQAAMSLSGEFQGRRAAVALPMGSCDLHLLEDIVEGDASVTETIRAAISAATQLPADDLEFDYWPAEFNSRRNQPAKWNVLAVARPWVDHIYDHVSASGLRCQAIDGVPTALARALQLGDYSSMEQPLAALDWGYSQATFCVALEGRPVYVRNLKDCGLQRLLAAAAEELAISQAEAWDLFARHGIVNRGGEDSDEMVELMASVAGESLRQLEHELSRTLTHLELQRRTIVPQELVLFGGGALLRGIETYLQGRLTLRTRVWSLRSSVEQNPTANPYPDCLLGTALALSALAWEES